MSTPDPRPSTPPFTELEPADVTRVTGGQFDWSSLAQSLMQNVSGQLGGSGSPAGGMLGMVAGMLGMPSSGHAAVAAR